MKLDAKWNAAKLHQELLGAITVIGLGTLLSIARVKGYVETVQDLMKHICTVQNLQSVSTASEITQQTITAALLILLIMRVLQNNIQSVNTSLTLLNEVSSVIRPDIILLQEVWHPKDNEIWVKDYQCNKNLIWTRPTKEGGGVAILVHKKVKVIPLPEFNNANLEAVWAEVMVGSLKAVVGSVYIPPKNKTDLNVLKEVVHKIKAKHEKIIIGMDANARNGLWDDCCMGLDRNKMSVKKGLLLEEMIDELNLDIHNTGEPTYQQNTKVGLIQSSPDVTITWGIAGTDPVNWYTSDHSLNTPHEAIILDVGVKQVFEKREVVNWDKFNWGEYEVETKSSLDTLIKSWEEDLVGLEEMIEQLKEVIISSVEKIATKKIISHHTKPWINKEISDLLKALRAIAPKKIPGR